MVLNHPKSRRAQRAHEAHRIGLVNEVVPATELISRCEAILKQINGNASLAIRYSIDAVNEGVDTDLTSGLKLETKYFVLAADTEDKKEGTSAFVQKRAPQFQGK
jgi:enoyl-CoA hydratase